MTSWMKAAPCAAALLVACAPMKQEVSGTPGVCNAGTCFVDINVASCTPDGITATPDTLPVPATNHILWTMKTTGFKFPANGIVFTDPQFINPRVVGNGDQYTVHDKHLTLGTFKYTVTVVHVDGSACASQDPFVNNK